MMPSRVYSEVRKHWDYVEQYRHNGEAWAEVLQGSEDNAAMLTSGFNEDSYLGKGTVLQRDITDMPLHPDSEAQAQYMWDWSLFSPAGGWGAKTAINTSSQGTQPIHMYVVDSTHPDCHFQEFRNAIISGIPNSSHHVAGVMNGMIPMPSWAVPAQNQDRGMSIYDLGTGIMREYFMTVKNATTGTWSGGGGYSMGNPGLKDLAQTNYALQQRVGISNVTGTHNSLGFVGITEALNKKINHALCFTFGAAWGVEWTYPELLAEKARIEGEGKTLPANWPGHANYGTRKSWPARAADGKAEQYTPISTFGRSDAYNSPLPDLHKTPTHGQWGRLKADVDPMYDPRTGVPYRPFTRVLIEAAKKYGLVGTDTNLWVNAFNAEQGRTFAHVYGEDPWQGFQGGSGVIGSIYQEGWGGQGSPTDISDFPWDRTEWAQIDWGRPSPDFNLIQGQYEPWRRGITPSSPF